MEMQQVIVEGDVKYKKGKGPHIKKVKVKKPKDVPVTVANDIYVNPNYGKISSSRKIMLKCILKDRSKSNNFS